MKTKTCSEPHADIPASFTALPSSQAAKWRHVCAACAYELGRKHTADTEARLRERVRSLTSEIDSLKAKAK